LKDAKRNSSFQINLEKVIVLLKRTLLVASEETKALQAIVKEIEPAGRAVASSHLAALKCLLRGKFSGESHRPSHSILTCFRG
jgi:hypothetical protein